MSGTKIKCIIDPALRISEITWERILLNIEIESEYEEDLSFSIAKIVFPQEDSKDDDDSERADILHGTLLQDIPLVPVSVTGSRYRFCLNMSTMDGRSFLDNGRWRFIARRSEPAGPENDAASDKSKKSVPQVQLCTVSYEASRTLRDRDRIFSYGNSKYSYNVWFSTYCGDSVNMVPILNSRFMITNNDWRDHYNVKERVTLKGKVRCLIKKFKLWMMQFVYDLIEKRQPKNGKRILFLSETKPYIWGNLKYIDERLKERGLDKDYEISYSLKRRIGRRSSLKTWYRTLRLLAKQDFIFADDLVPIFESLKLRRTKLVQVWHAGEGFKAVGYSRFGKKGSPHPAVSSHRSYDYVITGSKRLVDVYSEVFGIPKENVLPLGMARLDGFLDEDVVSSKKKEFYDEHPECNGKKLILFAPTFRGTGQNSAFYDYDKLDMDAIYDLCADKYIWAFKMHPFTKGKPQIPDAYTDRIIDLTDSRDINDLYYVTDIMITDYSSAYYEFALMGRPILFYTYDRTVYEVHRGVHKSILETAPGKVCDTFDELIAALKAGDYELEKTLKFREENFGSYDGHAADRIIDCILLGKKPDQSNMS